MAGPYARCNYRPEKSDLPFSVRALAKRLERDSDSDASLTLLFVLLRPWMARLTYWSPRPALAVCAAVQPGFLLAVHLPETHKLRAPRSLVSRSSVCSWCRSSWETVCCCCWSNASWSAAQSAGSCCCFAVTTLFLATVDSGDTTCAGIRSETMSVRACRRPHCQTFHTNDWCRCASRR